MSERSVVGSTAVRAAQAGYPYRDALETEGRLWREITDAVRHLTPEERLRPGYYRSPDWSVRDVAAHLGTWLAEADRHFQQMLAGTYDHRSENVDVDVLNAGLLEAMRDETWDTVWSQANAARTMVLGNWSALPDETPEATWWIEKSGPAHYAEHLPRLHEWVAELLGNRSLVGDVASE